jgi:hypothetical protein
LISKKSLGRAFALLLFVAPALGQTGQNSHEQAAMAFLQAVGMDKIVQQISTALANNLIQSNPPLAAHRDVVMEWSNRYVTWEAAAPELVKTYELAFTEPELREIITFYETPTGQKMAAQLPQLMQGAAAAGGRLAGAHIADLQRMLKERINQPKGEPTAPAGR